MESAAVLRSCHYSFSTKSHLDVPEKPSVCCINHVAFSNVVKLPLCHGELISSKDRRGSVVVSCSNTSAVSAISNSNPNGAVLSGSKQNQVSEKKSPFSATFPIDFEALLTEVCEETKIVELKVKVGAFEVHMKRNVNGPTIFTPFVPQIAASPAPTLPEESSPAAASPPPKSFAEKVSPFTNASSKNADKIATLKASGSTNYVIVSSPKVGLFRQAKTLKGKKLPPACKEGDVIKEGQVIGFLEQLGAQYPIKSDVAGEVLKLLSNDEEAVGYGDPLVAVSPSF